MAPEEAPKGSWRLAYGIHRKTLVSRDSDQINGLESLEACKAEIAEIEKGMKQFGCYIWFATAYGPNGEEVTVHSGTPYC